MKSYTEADSVKIETVTALIYGDPSSGKTSFGFTCANPILLDFDGGAHRSAFRKNFLRFDSYDDFIANRAEVFKKIKGFDTVVVDAVGVFLDDMISSLKNGKDGPKLSRDNRLLYGRLKQEFSEFYHAIKRAGKNLVLVAHAKEKEEGDARIKRPLIPGGSYDIVMQSSDFVGLTTFKGNSRILNFEPSDLFISKDSAKIGMIEVPDFNREPNFGESILKRMIESMNAINEYQMKANESIKQWTERLNKIGNIEDLQKFYEDCAELKNGVREAVGKAFKEKAAKMEVTFDKALKKFVPAQTPLVKTAIPAPEATFIASPASAVIQETAPANDTARKLPNFSPGMDNTAIATALGYDNVWKLQADLKNFSGYQFKGHSALDTWHECKKMLAAQQETDQPVESREPGSDDVDEPDWGGIQKAA